MVYLGKISYGLYVWHLLVILVVERWPGVTPGHWTTMLLTLPITIVLASLSYRFLEAPFLRLKSKFAHVASRDERPAAAETFG